MSDDETLNELLFITGNMIQDVRQYGAICRDFSWRLRLSRRFR
jgi:hypothetical protein